MFLRLIKLLFFFFGGSIVSGSANPGQLKSGANPGQLNPVRLKFFSAAAANPFRRPDNSCHCYPHPHPRPTSPNWSSWARRRPPQIIIVLDVCALRSRASVYCIFVLNVCALRSRNSSTVLSKQDCSFLVKGWHTSR